MLTTHTPQGRATWRARDTVAELSKLADATRAVCQEHATPYPANVWGVGYQMSDTLAAQEALAEDQETV
jgi:hypothetical protein